VIAVDTNIVIRFLVADDVQQFEKAVQLFRRETIFVAKSVLLEAEWVLRRGYRQTPVKIADGFEALIDLPHVTCEDEADVRQALAWRHAGMDFAEALHLASSRGAARFATFDRAMITTATTTGLAVSEP